MAGRITLPTSKDAPNIAPRIADVGVVSNASRIGEAGNTGLADLAKGASDFASGQQAIAARMAKAQEKSDQIRESADRVRLKGEYNVYADDQFDATSRTKDFSVAGVAEEFGQSLDDWQAANMPPNLTPDGQVRWQEMIAEEKAKYSAKSAARIIKIRDARTDQLHSDLINGSVNLTRTNPGNWVENARSALKEFDKERVGATQQQEIDVERRIWSENAYAALDTVPIDGKGGLRDEMGNPNIQRLLSTERFKELSRKVKAHDLEQAASATQRVGNIPRDIYDAAPPEEQRIMRLGKNTEFNINTQVPAHETSLANLSASQLEAVNTSADVATFENAELDKILAGLKAGTFKTGSFSQFRHFGSRLLEFFDAPAEIRELAGSATTADMIKSAAAGLAVKKASNLGRVTNLQVQLILESLPDLMRTEDGNQILAEVMRRGNERIIEHSNIANRMLRSPARHLFPPNQESYWDKVRKLNEEDPIINDAMKARIAVLLGKDPAEMASTTEETAAPKGGTPVEEVKFTTVNNQAEFDAQPGGTHVIWNGPGSFKGDKFTTPKKAK